MSRLPVAKTFKMFVGGEFPRSESGRTTAVKFHDNDLTFANVCRASRKDLRNAVQIAGKAQPSWQNKTAYNRGQILYRMAEMTEAKRSEFAEVLTATLGLTNSEADLQIDEAIDAFVYYAGFSDKYQALLGSINPVAGPHHNFTAAEAVGVVAHISDDSAQLVDLVSELSAILVSGNSVVALLPRPLAGLIAPLAEVFATSDTPDGVVNLLTGELEELVGIFASHMEIHSISYQRNHCPHLKEVKAAAVENMKRVIGKVKKPLSLDHLISFVEYKTVWHPAGY